MRIIEDPACAMSPQKKLHSENLPYVDYNYFIPGGVSTTMEVYFADYYLLWAVWVVVEGV